jgi:hypothetical protein
MIDAIGWVATAVFLGSYACSDTRKLRLTQAAAALVWVAYGVLLHATPIIVANLLVAGVAAFSAAQDVRRSDRSGTAARAVTPATAGDLSRTS